MFRICALCLHHDDWTVGGQSFTSGLHGKESKWIFLWRLSTSKCYIHLLFMLITYKYAFPLLTLVCYWLRHNQQYEPDLLAGYLKFIQANISSLMMKYDDLLVVNILSYRIIFVSFTANKATDWNRIQSFAQVISSSSYWNMGW